MAKVKVINFFDSNNRILIRGTPEWDARETTRYENNCGLLSFGTIEDSLATNGKSAQYRPGSVF